MISNYKTIGLVLLLILSLPLGKALAVQVETIHNNNDLITRVAPGESLPVVVKLSNFGGGERVDVRVNYDVVNGKGETIYSANETVAVETTASFIKTLPIPANAAAGKYKVQIDIVYPGQVAQAVTEFSFAIEQKTFGLFKDDLWSYGGLGTFIGLAVVFFGYHLIKRRQRGRFTLVDYSDVAHDQRVFYELISDTIMEMRGRVGDDALMIAAHTDGLKIDVETGRVLALTAKPSKVIALLVAEYEKRLGKRVSFSFRK